MFFDLSIICKLFQKFKNKDDKIEYGKIKFLPDEILYLSFKQYHTRQSYLVKD
jgi:hypothetical protein